MKHFLRYVLQNFLGFSNYLFIFSIVSIKRIRSSKSEEEFMHFVQLVPNEGVILDIGANIGITTVPLAQENPNALIYSFEPMPENLFALTKVVRFFKLKNVKIFDLALGDTDGNLKMVMPVINKVKMQGLSHIQTDKYEQNDGREVIVTSRTLDSLTELPSQTRITGIKIDVENFEYFVLKGASRLLVEHKPIIYCELWENEMREKTINFLVELGYKIKVFRNGKLNDLDDQNGINFFFIPMGQDI